MMLIPKSIACLGTAALAIALNAQASDPAGEVRRLQQLREQQQMQLQLKMQQQHDRALASPAAPRVDFQRQQLERDQQQRQRGLHEQQSRAEAARSAAEAAPGGAPAGRAEESGAEQLKRFEWERRQRERAPR